MSGLTNEEKLYVLYTKGHFSKYKDAQQIILGEYYDLAPAQITKAIVENFMVDLFVKLASVQAIQMNYNESIAWLLNEVRDIGSRPLACNTLHDWLHSKIVHALPTQLDLDKVDRTIEQKMKLIQEWMVVTNCPHYESPTFETQHEAVEEAVLQKSKSDAVGVYYIPLQKENVYKGNWVYAEPLLFVWSSEMFGNIYQVIEAANHMYPGDFFVGQRTMNDVINIQHIQRDDEQKCIQALYKERLTETDWLQAEALKQAAEKELDNYIDDER